MMVGIGLLAALLFACFFVWKRTTKIPKPASFMTRSERLKVINDTLRHLETKHGHGDITVEFISAKRSTMLRECDDISERNRKFLVLCENLDEMPRTLRKLYDRLKADP